MIDFLFSREAFERDPAVTSSLVARRGLVPIPPLPHCPPKLLDAAGIVPVLGVLPKSVTYQTAPAIAAKISTMKIRHERREF